MSAAYRVPDVEALERTIDSLRTQVAELRAEVAGLSGGGMPVHVPESPCRKCGRESLNVGLPQLVRCVNNRWQPARRGIFGWGRRPERIRRDCMACKAVWFEQPLDRR